MHEFYEGLIAGIAMLGGLCAFIFWVFNLLERRLEIKIDVFSARLDTFTCRLEEIVAEQADQRKRTDQLYQIVIDLLKQNKPSQTNP